MRPILSLLLRENYIKIKKSNLAQYVAGCFFILIYILSIDVISIFITGYNILIIPK